MESLKIFFLLFALISSVVSVPLNPRQVPVPGPIADIGGGTYPRATRLADGSILAAFTAYRDGQAIITTAKSTDNGGSFREIGAVAQGPTAAKDIDNPYLVQIPGGRILCAFRDHDKVGGAYGTFRLTVTFSDDGGVMWKYLSTPASDPGPPNGNWEPLMRVATDGSLQLYYSREVDGGNQDNLMRVSNDGGASWSGASNVSGADIGSRDGMIGITTTTSPKDLIAVFEVYRGRGAVLDVVFSNDDGRSWGGRKTIYTPPGPPCTNAGAPQIVNTGGILAIVFMTDEDTGACNLLKSSTVKVLTSGDMGNTWGNKINISPAHSAWPGIIASGDREFLALYEHIGAKAMRIGV